MDALVNAEKSVEEEETVVEETAKEPSEKEFVTDEENAPTNNNRDDLVLSFENVTVHVPGKERRQCCAKCIDSPIRSFVEEYLGVGVEEADAFYSLDLVSGSCRMGEMCLVLGSNDIGKSTLLRSLCGRLNVADEFSGALLLNGMPLGKSHQGWRRMTPYVSASDASHAPVLTVRETFTFAAQCTSDGKQSWTTIQDKVDGLLKVLGLDHVADTVVGDENLRGVSGGQKRRVTVGEMMTDPGACFYCLENITDGLASTDSKILIENLARACRTYHRGALVSLLQPSDEVVMLFDKLLVLTSQGEMAYFGPIKHDLLSGVFLGPAEDQTSLDYGSICDMVLSQTDEDAVVRRFRASETYKELVNGLAMVRSQAPPARSRNVSLLLPDKKYSTSRRYQFKILSRRKIKLIARNAVTYTRVVIAVVFGVIIGSLFSALNNDIIGSLARTGYLFLNSFLVLMLSSAITIPDAFRQRTTVFKHRSAEFFSGRVSYLVQVFLDLPLSVLEAILLASVSYFWVDMNPGASNFFYFLGALVGLECVGQSYARLLSALVRKQVSASALSSISILICGTVGGFMPAYGQIPWVLRWLSWLTPVSYAFEGMMINEFADRELYGIALSTQNGETTVGTIEGEGWLAIYDLPRADWGSFTCIKIFDLFMLFLFSIIYDLIGFYFVEHTRGWSMNQSRRPQSRVRSDYLHSSESGAGSTTSVEGADGVVQQEMEESAFPETLSVRNLTYSVRLKRDRRCTMESLLGPRLVRLAGKAVTISKQDDQTELTLLSHVDACFRRSRMTALMGPSGCGKTTLMDVIAGYKTGGVISGDVMINGRPKDDSVWKKLAGYAEQMDILNPYLSVMETLRFTTLCRLSRSADINSVVEQVVHLIRLVGRPKILFLDEPTTGLGTKDASLVIKAIRRSTNALGLITLATIHQPSKFIWDAFDDVLLLSKGGRVAYMGEMGASSRAVLHHFAALSNVDPPSSCNPADFVLESLTSVSTDKAIEAFQLSSHRDDLIKQIEDTIDVGKKGKQPANSGKATSGFMEVLLLFKRHIITQWRNPSYSFMRIICSISASMYMGILFFGDKTDSIEGAVSSIGAVFFFVFILVIPMAAGIVPLVEDRAVLYRETVSGTYSRLSYGLGLLFADVPFHMLNALLMFISFYYLVGFGRDGDQQGYFLLMLLLANWVIMSMGQLFALVTPNEESANGLAGLAIILSVILMGFLITVEAMPDGWVWAYWTNLLRYILQGLVTNELAGTTYQVDLGLQLPNLTGLATVDPPSQLVVFGPGVDPTSDARARQASTLLSLVAETGGGVNSQSSIGDLANLVDCLITNECLEDPVLRNFFVCTMFNPIPGRDPVCGEEFDMVVEGIDLDEILKCFDEPTDNTTDVATNGRPTDFTLDDFDEMDQGGQRDLILCLLRAILPPELVDAIERIVAIIKNLLGIILSILEVIQNGIQLPGELILFFFGWADFEDGEFVAPYKWFYCMSSVAIFLGGIEILKLGAVSFIVWITR